VEEAAMMDLVYIGLTLVLLAVTLGMVRLFGRL
jgi:hypothetical protein